MPIVVDSLRGNHEYRRKIDLDRTVFNRINHTTSAHGYPVLTREKLRQYHEKNTMFDSMFNG
jgi:hypothetical protein